MLPTLGFQELLVVGGIILALSMTGLWPHVVRGLRELRGDAPPPPPPASKNKSDLELCYRILGVSPSANFDEVERAYRRKAKLHHPDLGGDEDMMRAVNEAYALIKKMRR